LKGSMRNWLRWPLPLILAAAPAAAPPRLFGAPATRRACLRPARGSAHGRHPLRRRATHPLPRARSGTRGPS
jgi:hypothetical protein